MRLNSIRARILGGFVALILLQAGVAAAVWRAENDVDAAIAAVAATNAGSEHIVSVRAALSQVQLRMSNFVRTGAAADHERLDKALAELHTQIDGLSGVDSAAQLVAGIDAVRTQLDGLLAPSLSRRDSLARLMQADIDAENALWALSQAAVAAPERATIEAALTVLASALHPLILTQRYAVSADELDARAALAAVARVRQRLSWLPQDERATTPRIRRLAGIVAASMDALQPALEALGTSHTNPR